MRNSLPKVGLEPQCLRVVRTFGNFRWKGWVLLSIATVASVALGQSELGAIKGVRWTHRSPDGLRTLVQFQASEAVPIGPNRFRVKTFRLTKFNDRVEVPELLIEAPECEFDSVKKEARSAGRLKVTSITGQFRVEGQGFSWDNARRRLVISNQLVNTIPGKHLKLEKKP